MSDGKIVFWCVRGQNAVACDDHHRAITRVCLRSAEDAVRYVRDANAKIRDAFYQDGKGVFYQGYQDHELMSAEITTKHANAKYSATLKGRQWIIAYAPGLHEDYDTWQAALVRED